MDKVDFARDELLAREVDLISEAAEQKGLALILETEQLPERMRGDLTRLAQAPVKLLSNAVKFTHRGWVNLRCLRLAEDGAYLLLRFEVRDTGIGIPKASQARLFKAFEQADESITRSHAGTGWGWR